MMLTTRSSVAIMVTVLASAALIRGQGSPVTLNVEVPPEAVTEVVKLYREAGGAVFDGFDDDKICGPTHPMVFFEEAGCQQNIVGTVPMPSKAYSVSVENELDCFDDNEADSVLFTHRFPCGSMVRVCDDAVDCLADDKATIYLKKPLPENQVYCVTSFEVNFEDEYVKVVYDQHESEDQGLNGKVSRVEIQAPGVVDGAEHDVIFECGDVGGSGGRTLTPIFTWGVATAATCAIFG